MLHRSEKAERNKAQSGGCVALTHKQEKFRWRKSRQGVGLALGITEFDFIGLAVAIDIDDRAHLPPNKIKLEGR
jgi:hypothetical protein